MWKAVGWLCLMARVAWAVDPPPPSLSAVRLVPVARGLDKPVFVTYAPSDSQRRLFVVEKTGRIRVLRNGKVEPTPFLDLSGRVSNGAEQGLLGLAFHPKFSTNGRFFVNLTDRKGDTRVLEFRVGDAGRPDPNSERQWLFFKQPWANHNGGHLAFGPDGKLWVGTGDGGAANDPGNRSQSSAEMLGKMLRVSVDGEPNIEVAYRGLRNPWRYSFDRKTSDLYIGDVGQDRWEEIDFVAASELQQAHNFGWNVREGRHCLRGSACATEGFREPIVEYGHKVGCSVTGGYVYRGKALPALDGLYLYADFCTAMIRALRVKEGRAVEQFELRPVLDPDNRLAQISSFGEDVDGELYLVSLEGTLWRIGGRALPP